MMLMLAAIFLPCLCPPHLFPWNPLSDDLSFPWLALLITVIVQFNSLSLQGALR
jgi:hypothetical protein